MDVLYKAHATASGGGRAGRSHTDDGKIDVALSNSFGFGGTNASVIFKRV